MQREKQLASKKRSIIETEIEKDRYHQRQEKIYIIRDRDRKRQKSIQTEKRYISLETEIEKDRYNQRQRQKKIDIIRDRDRKGQISIETEIEKKYINRDRYRRKKYH